MPLYDYKDKVIAGWLSASAADLKSAKLLYDNKLTVIACIFYSKATRSWLKGFSFPLVS